MKAHLLAIIGVLAMGLVGCDRTSIEGPDAPGVAPQIASLPTAARVVVLVVDGARWQETFGDSTHSNIPNMWNNLRPQGTLFTDFRNEGVTKTTPGHSSMMTGTWQTIANDGSERPDKPTLFEYFRQAHGVPQSDTYVVSGKSKLFVCSYGTDPGYGSAYGATEDVGYSDDLAVYNELLSVMQTDQPLLTLACFPSVDLEGHSGVFNNYLAAIQNADSLVDAVWSFIQADPFYQNQTYLFVTNDHGRHDDQNGGFQNHGDDCEGCEHIMLLVLGPTIRQGHTVTTTYTQPNICPTVGTILNFATPQSGAVVIAEMFQSTPSGIPSVHP